MSFAWKLLTLIAVLLLPFGMTAAPAASAMHHGSAAGMPEEHCPDKAPKSDSKAGFPVCTMACSAALPAANVQREQHHLIVCVPEGPETVERLQGLHPDTATPPPKMS